MESVLIVMLLGIIFRLEIFSITKSYSVYHWSLASD